jgi:threonine/homoserine/homoserine lactone efflux protein
MSLIHCRSMEYLSSLILGLLLSFFGQLPLGTISLTATQIAVQEHFRHAWKYSIGVALIEMGYLRLVLSGMEWIMHHQILFYLFNWISVLFFLVLGVMGFFVAHKQNPDKKALHLNYPLDRLLLGLSMSTLNLAQIPFWFLWSGYFLKQGWLHPGFADFNCFTLGSGLGTLGGLAVYMYGGTWLVTKMKTSNRTLNKITGVFFIIAAAILAYRILWS